MKKGLKIVGLFIIIVLACCGCDIMYADTTRDIRHSGFALSGAELVCDELFEDVEFEKIKFLTGKHVITESGYVYELSISQKFSNEQNCMPSPLLSKVEAIFDDNVVRTDDGKYYYLVKTNDGTAYSVVPNTDNNFMIYDIILKDKDVVKVKTVDTSAGHYYVLKKDGNVYNYIIIKDQNNVSIASTPIIYSKNNYDGAIIDFSFAGKSTATSIRTATQIFRMSATNKEECYRYVDVPCNYEMRLDENLTEHQDRIFGFSGTYLITTYGKQFNVTG